MVYDYRMFHGVCSPFAIVIHLCPLLQGDMKVCLPEEVMKPERNMTSEGKQQGLKIVYYTEITHKTTKHFLN